MKLVKLAFALMISVWISSAQAGLMYVADFEFTDTGGGGTIGPISGLIYGILDSDQYITIDKVVLTGIGGHPTLETMEADFCRYSSDNTCVPLFELDGSFVEGIGNASFIFWPVDATKSAYPARLTVAGLTLNTVAGATTFNSYASISDTNTRSRISPGGVCTNEIRGCVVYRQTSGDYGVSHFRQVPEPSTIAIFALGLICLVSRRFKR